MVRGRPGSGLYSYFPVNQHNYGQEVRRCLPPNVFVAQVSPMDRHGYVHLSCDLIMTLEHVYRADKIIFEVNARAPMVWGESALPISMADVVYEVDEPIFQLQDPPIGGEGGDHCRLCLRPDEGRGLYPAGIRGASPTPLAFT